MADLPLKAPPAPVAAPPPLYFPPAGLPMIRLIHHIASSFPTPIVGFGSGLAAEVSQSGQQLTLTHPHG
jgi:hypothetical protein